MEDIDNKLADLAKEIAQKAYAPYSKFRVGAALISESGNIYTGNFTSLNSNSSIDYFIQCV